MYTLDIDATSKEKILDETSELDRLTGTLPLLSKKKEVYKRECRYI